MHHTTDVEAGKKLGTLVYEQFKTSEKFQDDFKKNKSMIVKQK